MIRAFLFDNGGVMTAGGGGNELSERLGKNLHMDPDNAYKLLAPFWDDYACGKLSEAALWAGVEKQYGMPIGSEQRDIWNHWEHMQPLPEMLAFVYELKSAGMKVGLLSNVIPNTEQEIRSHGGYDGFDFLILSCEVGVVKPDRKIYKLALEQLKGIVPEQVVFLDDQERCLVPARELGINTVLVNDATQAITAARAIITASKLGTGI